MKEYLVTGQGYDKSDEYKQTILLHDSFLTDHADKAKEMFTTKFEPDFHIINIYSVMDLNDNGH